MELTSITPGPASLRALAHPVRLRLLGLLRAEGPATATGLAVRLGLTSGATSYHLRQLALHGFIEDVPGREGGRDRWWRAAHHATSTRDEDLREDRETHDAYLQAVAVVQTEQLQRAVEERGLLPDDWRSATAHSDWSLRLTPRRAAALVAAIEEVVAQAEQQEDDEEAADFVVQLAAFPRPGTVAPAAGEGA